MSQSSDFQRCPECRAKTERLVSLRSGDYQDYIVNCPRCPWITVITEVGPPPEAFQLPMFASAALQL